MLGDIPIAEPGAVIGFAGARVIEETIREKLPEGFQRAEYLLEHGMVDMVVPRGELRDTLIAHLSTCCATRRRARRADGLPQCRPAGDGHGQPRASTDDAALTATPSSSG